MRSAVEWAQVRAMVADGVTQREIARRLGINRRTVKRLVEASEPPRYERAPTGSMLDPLEPVIRRLVEEWSDIKAPRVTEVLRGDYGYTGSVDLVRRRMAALRPQVGRPAQRTGYRPGQVMQVDWAEMPTRPRIAGRERRVYALICSLPFSGASAAYLSFDMTIEAFLEEGHVRAFAWLGGVPRECVYDNLRSAVARRERDVVTWNARFVQLRGHYAFHATACTPQTPREKGSVGTRAPRRLLDARAGAVCAPVSCICARKITRAMAIASNPPPDPSNREGSRREPATFAVVLAITATVALGAAEGAVANCLQSH